MLPSSLRLRILICFWGLLLILIIPLYLFLTHTVRSDIITHGQERAQKLLDATCWLTEDRAFPGGEKAVQNWLTQMGSRLNARLTYTLQGRVVADSHVRWERIPAVEDHGERPEIMAAQRGQTGSDIRRSDTIGRDLIYVAQACAVDEDENGVLRLALPLSNLHEQVDTLKKRFFVFLGAGFAASLFLSLWFTRSILGPIQKLISLVSDVGQGAYHRRLHVSRNNEFFPLVEAVNTMAHDISRHVHDMEEQKSQLEALFNGLNEAVLTVGQDGRIVSANPAFRKFFPKIQNIEGRPVLEATLEPDLAQAMQRTLSGQSSQEERLLLQRPGGNELEAKIHTYHDPSGKLRAVVVVQDVSLARRMEKIRRDFVANVSHEMRTPLTSIKGYTETLLGDPPPDPETSRSFLKIIHRNAEHMAAIVTDLLKLAKLEVEAPGGALEIMDAQTSFNAAMEICSSMVQGKALQVENTLYDCDTMVLGDQSRITQVFQNILENAIRFSPRQGRIRVTCKPEGEHVVFRIQDNGPGIPREHQERLFERFYRQDAARTEGNGGTGLGLAICKHIVRYHGGKIWVESIPGEGASFLFTLKAAPGHERRGR
jgi:two-component system, OmpR family, phosphate regulon sensor histidine kinase PhoR